MALVDSHSLTQSNIKIFINEIRSLVAKLMKQTFLWVKTQYYDVFKFYTIQILYSVFFIITFF